MKLYINFRQDSRRIMLANWTSIETFWNIFYIRKLIKIADDLREKFDKLAKESNQLEYRFNDVKEYPWLVSLQARELFEYYQQAQKLVQNLPTLGLQGEELTQYIHKLDEIQKISHPFLSIY